MMLRRTPQSIASSSRHMWASPVPVLIASTAIVAPPETLVLNVRDFIVQRHGQSVTMPRTAFLIFAAIACAGRFISRSEITEYVWGDDEDGGPGSSAKYIDVVIHRIRKMISPLSIGISNRYTFGFQLVDACQRAEAA